MPPYERPLAHREGCQRLPDHLGSCCTDDPLPAFDSGHGATCPSRPEQVITADRLDLAVKYAMSHGTGGFTAGDIEYPRLRTDQARSDLNWDRMAGELQENNLAKLKALAAEADAADTPRYGHEAGEDPGDDEVPPDDGGGIPTAKVARYQELRNKEKAAKAEHGAIKDLADALEAELVDEFGEAGLQSLNINGQTAYLKRTTFASWHDVPPEERQALLIEAGLEDLITTTVNANTLAAYVRECLGDDDNPGPGVPELLRDKLDLGERFNIGLRASAGARARKKS